jgi:hypothetical protein
MNTRFTIGIVAGKSVCAGTDNSNPDSLESMGSLFRSVKQGFRVVKVAAEIHIRFRKLKQFEFIIHPHFAIAPAHHQPAAVSRWLRESNLTFDRVERESIAKCLRHSIQANSFASVIACNEGQ